MSKSITSAPEPVEVGELKFAYRNEFDRRVIKEVVEDDIYHVACIPDESLVIDIGAHIGTFAIKCAREHDCIVYAYEPIASSFRFLKENVVLNRLEREMKIFPWAVVGTATSEVDSLTKRYMYYDEKHFEECSFLLPKEETEEVLCISMTELLKEYEVCDVDVLKLDCEGMELEIIMTAHLDHVRKIIMETHWNLHRVLLDLLRKQGFYADFKQASGIPERGIIVATR